MDVVQALHGAREAYKRREWLTAYNALSALDDSALIATDFLALADAAELLGHAKEAVQALHRAHRIALEAAELLIAARAAARLALVLVIREETAIAGGWLARAERLLDEIGRDTVERGYVLIGRMLERVSVGDLEGAAPLPQQIIDCGHHHSDANLLAMGLNQQGRVLTVFGRIAEGLQFLDEAMTGVISGEVDDPLIAGEVYCSMIEACQWVGDWGRAAEWTHALTNWCDEQLGLVAFTGQCAVHRAQLMRFTGAFSDAIAELERAVQRYEAMGSRIAVALAFVERGNVLCMLGDLDGADRAYTEAELHGGDVQLGRALLSLRRGNLDHAEAMVRRILHTTHGAIFRHQLIPGCVEVLMAAGCIDEASTLAEELVIIAENFGCVAVRASASAVVAQVCMARDDPDAALSAAMAAQQRWLKLDAAYEAARSRVLIGRALRLLGDESGAELEFRMARAVFESQGAASDARNVADLLGEIDRHGGLTTREVEVLRLVAAGKSNAQIASELFLSIKTVARHLSNIFTKLDVGSRTQAVALAHQHKLI